MNVSNFFQAIYDLLVNPLTFLYNEIDTVVEIGRQLFTWVWNAVSGIIFMIGSICPNEIALVITPILVAMFAFLGIKLLVRLL